MKRVPSEPGQTGVADDPPLTAEPVTRIVEVGVPPDPPLTAGFMPPPMDAKEL